MCTIWQKPVRRKLSQPPPAGTPEQGRRAGFGPANCFSQTSFWSCHCSLCWEEILGYCPQPACRRPGRGEGQATLSCCEDSSSSSILRCSRAHSYACPSASSLHSPILQPEATDKTLSEWRGLGKPGWCSTSPPGEDGQLATRDGRVTTARPGRLTVLLSAIGFVFMQKNPKTLPIEHTATCLVDFESCRSKRNIVVEIKARNQVSEQWGEQLMQVSRQVHLLQTQPELPFSDQGILDSIWKWKPIYENQSQSVCRRNRIICDDLNSRAQWCSQGITKGRGFGTYLVTSMWRF